MKKISILFFLSYWSITFANMSPKGFEQFPNKYFVGTGAFSATINLALRAKFSEIHYIVPDGETVENTRNYYQTYSNIKVWYADSSLLLGYIISKIDQPITFWLDGGMAPRKGFKSNPILDELEFINQHPIKTHTILIDDMHVVGSDYFDGVTKEKLIEKLLEINPNYTITYVDGGERGEYKNNVMVAFISK